MALGLRVALCVVLCAAVIQYVYSNAVYFCAAWQQFRGMLTAQVLQPVIRGLMFAFVVQVRSSRGLPHTCAGDTACRKADLEAFVQMVSSLGGATLECGGSGLHKVHCEEEIELQGC